MDTSLKNLIQRHSACTCGGAGEFTVNESLCAQIRKARRYLGTPSNLMLFYLIKDTKTKTVNP